MRVGVVGCGYLGAVHAACMAHIGHDVIGLDVNAAQVEALNAGIAPFHEPGFAELLAQLTSSSPHQGSLHFTTDPRDIADIELIFLAVGTPQLPGRYGADVSAVHTAFRALMANATTYHLVVGKSTVPVGTAAELASQAGDAAVVAWNPEFLREGHAVHDTLHPHRIVYGLPPEPGQAAYADQLLEACYAPLVDAPRLRTNYATAELVKVAANSFLATKISFINAMAELSDATGADVMMLSKAIGYDPRIAPQFLHAGIGFGGGCLPKDIRAFMARAGELGVDPALTFLREVDAINLRARDRAVNLADDLCGGRFVGHKIAVLGATFKPNSDDLRDSPALDIAQRMWSRGADLVITDPAAGAALRVKRPNLQVADTPEEAVQGADVVMLLTEWPQYTHLDPVKLRELVHTPAIVDGRNVLDPDQWKNAGWIYRGMGRR